MDVKFSILVNGASVKNIEDDVAQMVVDSTIGLPSMFHIILGDYQNDAEAFEYIDAKKFDLGKKIEIAVQTQNGMVSLIEGEITAIEPDFTSRGSVQLHIRGYDFSYKLSQGKKTRSFLKQKDSDVVQKICGENGLSAEVDATTTVHDNLLQVNQTDWEFIQSRARMIGYQVYCQNKKIFFKKVSSMDAPVVTLTWGDNLASFRPRLSSMGQHSETNAYGWDVKKKQAVTGTATPTGAAQFHCIGEKSTGGAAVKKLVNKASINNTLNLPIDTVNQSKSIAEADLLLSESQFIQAEGECVEGNPRLLAGTTVEIKNVGTRFGGKYFVTQARHEFHHGQYRVWFSNHGIHPETVSGLLSSNTGSPDSGRIPGVVSAIVTNNNGSQDEMDAGRVKVKYPWMPKSNGAEIESDWARIAIVGGGAQRGMYFMPEVNDEVLVAFEQGDVNRPYVIGGLWNGVDKPAEVISKIVSNGKVNLRLIKTRSGHQILLDDTQGSEKITIIDKTQANSIVIDSKNNTVIIKSKADMTFESGGKLTLNCNGDFAVNAKGAAKMDSKNTVKITGVGAIDVKSNQAVTVSNAAGNKLDLAPSGATLQGITTAVKGSAVVQIKGALVQIN